MINKQLYKVYPNDGMLTEVFPDTIRKHLTNDTFIIAPVGNDFDKVDLQRVWYVLERRPKKWLEHVSKNTIISYQNSNILWGNDTYIIVNLFTPKT